MQQFMKQENFKNINAVVAKNAITTQMYIATPYYIWVLAFSKLR